MHLVVSVGNRHNLFIVDVMRMGVWVYSPMCLSDVKEKQRGKLWA